YAAGLASWGIGDAAGWTGLETSADASGVALTVSETVEAVGFTPVRRRSLTLGGPLSGTIGNAGVSYAVRPFPRGSQAVGRGPFLNAAISSVLIALVLFYLVVKPVNALMARRRAETPVDETTRPCPECLSQIPIGARRCAFCTAEVAPAV